jgi:hypothetical protein
MTTKMNSRIGYDAASEAILEGRARPHALWLLLGDESDRNGYGLKPCPWEGAGEYQCVSFADGRSLLVRLPDHRHLPRTGERNPA